MSMFLPDGPTQPTSPFDVGSAPSSPQASQGDIALMQRVLAAASQNPNLIPADFMSYVLDWIQTQRLEIPITQVVGYHSVTQSSRVHLAVNQAVATGATRTQVHFDTVEFDYGGLWDATNHEFVIGLAGKYIVGGSVTWAPNASGDRYVTVRHNGSEKTSDARLPAGGGGIDTDHGSSAVLDLAIGDTLDLAVVQTSGGDLNITADDRSNLWVVRVGP